MRQVTLGDGSLELDRLEDEIGRVDLAMRMGIGDPYNFSFVLEDKHVSNFWAVAKVEILILPYGEKVFNFGSAQLGQRHIVSGAVANHPGDSRGRPAAKYSTVIIAESWRIQSDARVIVIEDKCCGVKGIAGAANAGVTGTEVAIRVVPGQPLAIVVDCLTAPRSILPVGRHNNPFCPQRVPTFFPNQSESSSFNPTNRPRGEPAKSAECGTLSPIAYAIDFPRDSGALTSQMDKTGRIVY
jgi:hypothetical protein